MWPFITSRSARRRVVALLLGKHGASAEPGYAHFLADERL